MTRIFGLLLVCGAVYALVQFPDLRARTGAAVQKAAAEFMRNVGERKQAAEPAPQAERSAAPAQPVVQHEATKPVPEKPLYPPPSRYARLTALERQISAGLNALGDPAPGDRILTPQKEALFAFLGELTGALTMSEEKFADLDARITRKLDYLRDAGYKIGP